MPAISSIISKFIHTTKGTLPENLFTRKYKSTSFIFKSTNHRRLSAIISGASIISITSYFIFSNDADLVILCDKIQDISKRLITISPETNLFIWGDNYYGIANPLSDSLSIKYPSPIDIPGTFSLTQLKLSLGSLYESKINISELKMMFGSRIKAVTMAQKHAACIDPSGNLVQWGHGFNGLLSLIEAPHLPEDTAVLSSIPLNEKKDHLGLPQPDIINRAPECTISGHKLTYLTSTKEHIVAVNAQGKLYISDGIRENPQNRLPVIFGETLEIPSIFQKFKNYFNYSAPSFIYNGVKVIEMSFLTKNEKIIQLVSGDHHVVLLSNTGNVYTMAINSYSNMFGQLGFDSSVNKGDNHLIKLLPIFQLPPPQPVLSSGELIQKAIEASESFLKPNPHRTHGKNPQHIAWRDSILKLDTNKAQILQDPLFWRVDIGGSIVKIAAGTHHTLLQTSSGQIWGFGANGYGQLGPNLPVINEIPKIIIPSFSTPIKDIWAGGDTSAYLTESTSEGLSELYSSGAGIWGQLGNGTFRQIQSTMVPVTDLSRLAYYDETAGKMAPISLNSLSIGRTHLAAVLKTSVDNRNKLPHFGFNVFTWGSNHVFQLGNGKRAMSSKPSQPNPLPAVKSELEQEGVKEIEAGSATTPKIGLQIFPGILRNDAKNEDKDQDYIIPPQRIICGHDTTAIF